MSRNKIRGLIDASGVSISNLATSVALHPSTIYNYLSFKSSLSSDNYEKLVNKLEILIKQAKDSDDTEV